MSRSVYGGDSTRFVLVVPLGSIPPHTMADDNPPPVFSIVESLHSTSNA